MKRASLLLFFCLLVTGICPLVAGPIDTRQRISLAFDETPLAAVLTMLAAQNDLNLVVSSAVDGDVTISLKDVTLRAALDALLLPNGFNYIIRDDIIIVKTTDQRMAGEIVPVTYQLQYIDAESAKNALEPLLSDQGKAMALRAPQTAIAATDERTISHLVVIDYPHVQEIIADFISTIDKRRRQIAVEVKIIETNLTDDEKLGINWPKSISASVAGVETISTDSDEDSEGADGGSKSFVMPLENGTWQLGYLSVDQLDVVIDFLKSRNNSKLLSNPRLTTLENETASIEIQTVIPIQTINRFSEGAVVQDIVTFQDEEVGISLKVTPRINDDSTITMKVNPIVQEIIGYTGTANNQKPITSERSIITNVTVGNNETIALGGLLKETKIENRERVFLLGSIPLLGGLFTHRSTKTETTDLMILITPVILE